MLFSRLTNNLIYSNQERAQFKCLRLKTTWIRRDLGLLFLYSAVAVASPMKLANRALFIFSMSKIQQVKHGTQ